MVYYSLGKVYKIVCNLTGDIYIGSTCQKSLALRLATHKHYLNTCRSRIIIDRGDYDMVLLEDCPCENKDQLHARERFHIDNNICINKKKPLTDSERENYRTNYNQQHKEYFKKWREERPNYMKEKCQAWRDHKKIIIE